MRRIGILTSGGDAPGMNACIRAAVRTALAHDLTILGIRRGYTGLIAGDAVPLDRPAIRNTIHLGGTILETSRNPEFYTKEGRLRAAAAIEEMDLDGIILIGGEGTFHGASLLAAETDPAALVGVPGSIDNDVYGTDYCIGFDTAANCAVQAIDRIRDTARSHERLFFIEVMGRTAGFLALESGIAGGAEELVIPEEELSIDRISERIRQGFIIGKKSAIVVVAEGKKPANGSVLRPAASPSAISSGRTADDARPGAREPPRCRGRRDAARGPERVYGGGDRGRPRVHAA